MDDHAYSVVIPAYNAEKYLAETLNSVLAQSLQPAHIIVVDDGSTDGTADIARNFGAKVDLIQTPNQGAATASNTGIGAATTPIIAFLDSDDIWLPQKMEIQVAHLRQSGDSTAGVTARMEPFGDDPSKTAPVEKSGWTRSTLVMRRDTFDRVGPLSELGHGYGELIDWLARAREAGLHIELLDVVLARRRIHKDSLSYKAHAGQSQDFLEAAKRALARKRQKKP